MVTSAGHRLTGHVTLFHTEVTNTGYRLTGHVTLYCGDQRWAQVDWAQADWSHYSTPHCGDQRWAQADWSHYYTTLWYKH